VWDLSEANLGSFLYDAHHLGDAFPYQTHRQNAAYHGESLDGLDLRLTQWVGYDFSTKIDPGQPDGLSISGSQGPAMVHLAVGHHSRDC
jgi:hypothetical protein